MAQAGNLVFGVNDYPSPEAARAALDRLRAALPEGLEPAQALDAEPPAEEPAAAEEPEESYMGEEGEY